MRYTSSGLAWDRAKGPELGPNVAECNEGSVNLSTQRQNPYFASWSPCPVHMPPAIASDDNFRLADNPRSRDSGVVLTGSLIPPYTLPHSGQALGPLHGPKRVPTMYTASLKEGGIEP